MAEWLRRMLELVGYCYDARETKRVQYSERRTRNKWVYRFRRAGGEPLSLRDSGIESNGMELFIQKRVLQDKMRRKKVEEKRSNPGRRWTGNFLFSVRHSLPLHSSYWVNASSHLSWMSMFFYSSLVLTPFWVDFSNNWNRLNEHRPLNSNLVREIKTFYIRLAQKSQRDGNTFFNIYLSNSPL